MITISYFWNHPPAELDDIKTIIEAVRQRAISLGFQHVSDLNCLECDLDFALHEFADPSLIVPDLPKFAICFSASLPDCKTLECGLILSAAAFNCGYWTWNGTIMTGDVRIVSSLFHFAAEAGIEAIMCFDGITMSFCQDEDGLVRIEVNMPPKP